MMNSILRHGSDSETDVVFFEHDIVKTTITQAETIDLNAVTLSGFIRIEFLI